MNEPSLKDAVNEAVASYRADLEDATNEAIALRAENKRLREALDACLRYTQHGFQEDVRNAANVAPDSAVAKVRAALNHKD